MPNISNLHIWNKITAKDILLIILILFSFIFITDIFLLGKKIYEQKEFRQSEIYKITQIINNNKLNNRKIKAKLLKDKLLLVNIFSKDRSLNLKSAIILEKLKIFFGDQIYIINLSLDDYEEDVANITIKAEYSDSIYNINQDNYQDLQFMFNNNNLSSYILLMSHKDKKYNIYNIYLEYQKLINDLFDYSDIIINNNQKNDKIDLIDDKDKFDFFNLYVNQSLEDRYAIDYNMEEFNINDFILIKGDDNIIEILLLDEDNHRIITSSFNGQIKEIIGGNNPNYIDGLFSEAKFNQPNNFIYHNNNIYIIDEVNQYLRMVDLEEKRVKSIIKINNLNIDSISKIFDELLLISTIDNIIYILDKNNKLTKININQSYNDIKIKNFNNRLYLLYKDENKLSNIIQVNIDTNSNYLTFAKSKISDINYDIYDFLIINDIIYTLSNDRIFKYRDNKEFIQYDISNLSKNFSNFSYMKNNFILLSEDSNSLVKLNKLNKQYEQINFIKTAE